MGGGDGGDDGQAQPGATMSPAAGAVGAVEAFEDALRLLGTSPGPRRAPGRKADAPAVACGGLPSTVTGLSAGE